MEATFHGRRVELTRGDITEQSVDAIVNAANARLAGGGGVDGAIHRRGGPSIMAETNRNYPDGCPTGSAVVSTAGDLPARLLIHTVGPVYGGGKQGEPEQLRSAYWESLSRAAENGCRSVAFPAISTGVYGYPLDQAAEIAIGAAVEFLSRDDAPELVRFVLFGESAYDAFAASLHRQLESGSADG